MSSLSVRVASVLPVVLFASGLIFHVGCTQQPPAAPPKAKVEVSSHRPANLAVGVTKLQELRDAVKAAFDSGDPHSCDGALHEAAEILFVLPAVAGEEGTLSDEDLETVKTTSKTLFDKFGEIHHGFHGEHDHDHSADASEPNVYDTVKADIDDGLKALLELSSKTN